MVKQERGVESGVVSRRAFLKSASAAVVVAASTTGVSALTACSDPAIEEKAPSPIGSDTKEQPAAVAETVGEDQIFYNSCKTACPSSCFVKAIVRDGKLVRTTAGELPDPRYNRLCLKGFSMAQHVYNPKRIQYPMRRTGERGEDKWERISWEEAIETITDNWKHTQAEYGPASLLLISGGSYANANFFSQSKLENALGAHSMDTGYDKALAYAATNYVGSDLFWYGNEYIDMLNAKTIVVWASNITEATPQLWHILADAQELGATLINIDPNYGGIASKCDYHVPVRPTTDGALALAMIKYVMDNQWEDRSFLKTRTVAPFLVKATDGRFLRTSDLEGGEGAAEQEKTYNSVPQAGAADRPEDALLVWDLDLGAAVPADESSNPALNGTFEVGGISVTTAYDLLIERVAPYTLDYAAEICDLDPQLIAKITEIYATNGPASIYFGIGMDHYANAHGAYGAMHTLGMVTGNMCKPGACAGQGVSASNALSYVNLAPPEGVVPAGKIPSAGVPDAILKGEFNGKEYNIRSIGVMGGNPIGNQTDRKAWIDAFMAAEFVFSVNTEWGDTTLYSDIVLPASSHFEYEDMHILNVATPYMYIQEKAIEPLYESKPNYEIGRLLMEAMGLSDYYPPTTIDWNTSELDNDNARALNISYERLKKEKAIRYLPDGVFLHAADGVFPTATGRAQFYQENPTPRIGYPGEIDVEKEHLPFFEPPMEAWTKTVGNLEKNELSDKYPLIYYNGSQRWRTHTTYTRHRVLRELDPEPSVRLSRKDAEDRGITDGDMVRIFNDRGFVVARAYINDGLRPGMINMDRGWQHDQFVAGHYSDLTHRNATAICCNNLYYDTLCEVEKYDGGEQ